MKKKNRYSMLLLSIICIFLMSGCVRYSATVEVKRNGKADVSMLMAVMKSDSEEDSSSTSDNALDKEKLESEGWEYQDYSEDNYKGYVITKHDIDLKELSEAVNNENSGIALQSKKIKILKDGSKYTISWDLSGNENDEDPGQYAAYLASAGGYVRFILKLPVKPISSNATEISEDGKTLTWDLLNMGGERKIEATFQLSNPMSIIIGIAVAVIIIICFAAFFISKKKKRLQNETEKEDQNNSFQSQSYQSDGQNTTMDADADFSKGSDYEQHILIQEEDEEITSTITASSEDE